MDKLNNRNVIFTSPATHIERARLAQRTIESVKPYWDRIYPERICDGSSGDPGAVEVVEIRKMINQYLNGYGLVG